MSTLSTVLLSTSVFAINIRLLYAYANTNRSFYGYANEQVPSLLTSHFRLIPTCNWLWSVHTNGGETAQSAQSPPCFLVDNIHSFSIDAQTRHVLSSPSPQCSPSRRTDRTNASAFSYATVVGRLRGISCELVAHCVRTSSTTTNAFC